MILVDFHMGSDHNSFYYPDPDIRFLKRIRIYFESPPLHRFFFSPKLVRFQRICFDFIENK